MKEMYQQAVIESEAKGKKAVADNIEITNTRPIKEKFEKGEVFAEEHSVKETEDMSVFESGMKLAI